MQARLRARGFTLIEVIAVLVLLAIIAAVVLMRMTSSAEANLKASAEALKSHIRYTQMRAMSTDPSTIAPAGCNASYGIGSDDGSSYFLFKDCSTDNKVTLPGSDGNRVTLVGLSLNPFTVVFDEWGRPCQYPLGTVASPTINLTLTQPGAGSEAITITRNTGYVP